MYQYDTLSNMGDISDKPTKYYDDDLKLSKYIINNLHKIKSNQYSNFESHWKNEGKLIITHINKLGKYIGNSFNILTGISYTFDGNVLDTRTTQHCAAEFIKNVADGKYFLENKKYFTYNDCDIKGNYYCQGMSSFDLISVYEEILSKLQYILNSYSFREIIEKNHFLTNKTISFGNVIKVFN